MRVLFFAGLGEKIGRGVVEVEHREGMSLEDLRLFIAERFPETKEVLFQAMMAVNHEYALPHQLLHPDDEIAFIPPVSGG
ncbi:molybdopterin converting factor subunit 1 [Thermicanus aegyptius]|uniref:molybdopterin converting factor subunit 1 n=1 Tax=Thermicanus aegyptius TaxID=94009 RepID=UPI00040F29AD|nr:molybdopterin converting factor subunit 1 [Thermicanus aegyptius]